MTKRTRQVIEFLKEADKLKDVQRGNRTGAGRPENPAEHSWHLCLALWLFKEELGLRFNLEKALKIALVHDLVEIYAGDTNFFDEEGRKDQSRREQQAAKKLFAHLPSPLGRELKERWEEYEARSSSEARLVKAFDIIIAVLQNIAVGGSGWRAYDVTYKKILAAKEQRIRPDFAKINKALWNILEDLAAEVKKKKLVRP